MFFCDEMILIKGGFQAVLQLICKYVINTLFIGFFYEDVNVTGEAHPGPGVERAHDDAFQRKEGNACFGKGFGDLGKDAVHGFHFLLGIGHIAKDDLIHYAVTGHVVAGHGGKVVRFRQAVDGGKFLIGKAGEVHLIGAGEFCAEDVY